MAACRHRRPLDAVSAAVLLLPYCLWRIYL